MQPLPAQLASSFQRCLDEAHVPKPSSLVAEKQGLLAHGPAGIVGSNFWCQRNFQRPGNLVV
jgi:hypothetical protein